jgi:transposase
MVQNGLKRPGIRLKLPPITAGDLEPILRRETRPHARKRLKAIVALLRGKSRGEAARAAGCSLDSVDRWLRAARRSGWQSLMDDLPGTRPKPVKRAARLREEIRRALNDARDPRERKRLTAVARVLDGERSDRTAEALGLNPGTVSRLLQLLRRGGIAALLKQERTGKPLINADATRLRTAAAVERDCRAAKRMQAMALLAEGHNAPEAAMRVHASPETIHAWVRAFRRGGIGALRAITYGRQRKLSPRQIDELAAILRGQPELRGQRLRETVKQRFGVDYTAFGLRRLLREDMGVR